MLAVNKHCNFSCLYDRWKWHREEEPLNHHETPGRQIKQSNQLSLPHQDDCNTKMDIK